MSLLKQVRMRNEPRTYLVTHFVGFKRYRLRCPPLVFEDPRLFDSIRTDFIEPRYVTFFPAEPILWNIRPSNAPSIDNVVGAVIEARRLPWRNKSGAWREPVFLTARCRDFVGERVVVTKVARGRRPMLSFLDEQHGTVADIDLKLLRVDRRQIPKVRAKVDRGDDLGMCSGLQDGGIEVTKRSGSEGSDVCVGIAKCNHQLR